MAIKICLDAGHYGKYNQSPANKNYYESEMTWKLHLLLKKHLEEYGFEVGMTRADQKKDLEVSERGRLSKGYDLLLSVHSNSVADGVNETVDRPSIFVQLDGKGDNLGKLLADCVAKTMGTTQSGTVNKRRGKRGEYYGVLRGAAEVGTMGIIVEHSFHTNTRSVKWLLSDANLDKMARAEAKAIADYYGLKEIAPSTEVLYKVQTGAYKTKAYAEEHLAKVKAAGFPTYLVKVDNWYKIQVGAYKKKANAENMLAKVKKAGFNAFIAVAKK